MQRTATAAIDINALKRNYQIIKSCAPNANILTVLKANAYGHGLIRIAKSLPFADAFGVARIDEALELRAGGITQPIVLLEGFFDEHDLQIIAVNNFQTIVHSEEQLQSIEHAALESPISVWLKVDTGMHRLGVPPEQFNAFYQRLRDCKNVQANMRLMSHFGCADEYQHPNTNAQLTLFNQLTADKTEQKSFANSAAICSLPNALFDWVRPGLMLYGISPFEEAAEPEAVKRLDPVMTLYSSIIAIRALRAGESVGYGAAWQSKKDTKIAVVAIGYGDGYPRHAPNGTPVLINGRIVPLIGRVSMDMITVDLGIDANDKVGDYVELWGKKLSVATIAQAAQTIPYELLCNISRRVKIDVSA